MGQILVFGLSHGADAVGEGGNHVVGDVAAVGPGIGQGLVPLIERLHAVQGLLGGIGVFLVCVALELRQIVGCGRRRHLPHLGDLCDLGLLARAGRQELLDPRPVEAVGVALLVVPGRAEARELRLETVVGLGNEASNFVLPFHHQGQGRGLDAARRELGVEFAGQGAGHVQTDQPVGLGPRLGGAEQIVVILCGPQVGEALPDGLVGLGGDPKPPRGLVPARLDHDPASDQLALASGVGGDHEIGNVSALHQVGHDLVLPRRLRDHDQLHLLRQHGQVVHIPFFQLLVVDVGVRERHQMAQGPGDDVAVALQIAVAAPAAAEDAGQLLADRGLLSQNQRFRHRTPPISPSDRGTGGPCPRPQRRRSRPGSGRIPGSSRARWCGNEF